VRDNWERGSCRQPPRGIMNRPFHVLRVQERHFLFQHIGRDDNKLCERPALLNSVLQALRNHAIVVCGYEDHVIAGLGIASLAHYQLFIGAVIREDLEPSYVRIWTRSQSLSILSKVLPKSPGCPAFFSY